MIPKSGDLVKYGSCCGVGIYLKRVISISVGSCCAGQSNIPFHPSVTSDYSYSYNNDNMSYGQPDMWSQMMVRELTGNLD
jgi:hypothetical protein